MFAITPPNNFIGELTQLLYTVLFAPPQLPEVCPGGNPKFPRGEVFALPTVSKFATVGPKQMFALNAKKTNLRSPVQFLPPWTKDISLSVDRMFAPAHLFGLCPGSRLFAYFFCIFFWCNCFKSCW